MKKIIAITLLFSAALAADIAQGEAVYKTNCAMCHTVDGRGGLGPDFNMVSYTRTKKQIAHYAKDPDAWYKQFGYSSNAMPTLPLKDQEIKDVADYIGSLVTFKKWMIKKK